MRTTSPLLWLALFALACGPAKRDTGGEGEGEGEGDHSDPFVSLDAPEDGAEVQGVVSWSATATDDRGVQSVRFTVEGEEEGEALVEPYEGSWDTTDLPNGSYGVAAVATDLSDNTSRASATVTVHNPGGLDPDAVLITSPTEGATVCGEIDVQTVVSDAVVQVVFSVNGVEAETDTSAPFAWTWDTLSTYDGEHSLEAVASDAEGNRAVDRVTVTVLNDDVSCDNAPSVVFIEPTDGETVGGAIDLSVSASDDDAVTEVVFTIDSGVLATDSAVPYETALSTADFSDGAHVLRAVATDSAGQTGEAEITVYFDNEAPVVAFDSPEESDELAGAVDVVVSATDAGGVGNILVAVDGEDLGGCEAETCVVALDTTALAFGGHTLSATATDLAGNEASASLVVTIDNPPEILFLSPVESEVSGILAVEVEATDDEGLPDLTLSLDGTELADSSTGSIETTINTCVESYGATLSLEAMATDETGDVQTATLDLRVDQPLEVEIDSFSGALDPTVTLSARVGDDQSLSSVGFTLDGASIATATAGASAPDSFDCGGRSYSASWSTASASEGSHTLAVVATNSAGDSTSAETTILIDYDQDDDGYDAEFYGGTDCDDDAADISPGDAEICDEIDQDCDGDADDDFDADGDGYLDAEACAGLATAEDCDDSDADVSPDGTEVCEDGVDEDCDGTDANCQVTGTHSASSVAIKWEGQYADFAGDFASYAGDVDGDGLDDVLVGAVQNEDGAPNGGATYLVPGSADSGGILGSSPTAQFYGSEDSFGGWEGNSAGDQDGDGYGELMLGAPYADWSTGYGSDGFVRIFYGPVSGSVDIDTADVTVWGDDYTKLGMRVMEAGDMNEDGTADLFVGAYHAWETVENAGLIYLLYGPVSSAVAAVDSVADARIEGEVASDSIGIYFDRGDANGDGTPDLLVGSPSYATYTAGKVYLLEGPFSGYHSVADADIALLGEEYDDQAGGDVRFLDGDGDGYDGIAVGASERTSGAAGGGVLYLIDSPTSGSTSVASADATISGSTRHGALGLQIAAGDLDADGNEDMLCGVSFASSGGVSSGVVYGFYGPVSGAVAATGADLILAGEAATDYFGADVDVADVDADGLGDVIVGANYANGSLSSGQGAAYLFPYASFP